ncbi:MAG: efflux RND transporter permease subunit, partial [Armatimonadetes bacterium]|nr:efflux RND transporter permease subunit [Armatimonadota bacterium]
MAKVARSGLLQQMVFLVYSQERLGAYGLSPTNIRDLLSARNIMMSGGQLDISGSSLHIDPSGAFKTPQDIANTVITMTNAGTPVYLRDLVDVIPS